METPAEGRPPGQEQQSAVVVLQPGQIIQDYEIIKPLGKGKFSIVYMAKRQSDDFVCALKKINIFDMMVPKQRDKCMKEVRLLQSLDHPNIVKLLESIIDKNDLLIIVEWAEKGDLKRLIRKAIANSASFKEPEIWEYSRQLAGALEHMHKKRIMHRDLKPANIFVKLDGSLQLGDLGLGRSFSCQTLEAFSKVGTPLYMSPEVLHGAGYDMRSDVWSLGCVLYELVVLRSPFKSDQQLSLYDLFVRISKGEYPPLPETTSPEFRDLVGKMLDLEPQRRIESEGVLELCEKRLVVIRAAGPAAGAAGDRRKSTSKEAPEQQSSSRPSPLLVMDDIVEKLKLLECEELVLQPRGFPLLHRCFFTQHLQLPGQLTQFEVMHVLLSWLLSMLGERERLAAEAAQARAADMSAGPCAAPSGRSGGGDAPGPTRLEAGSVGAGDAAAGCGVPPAARAKDPAAMVKEIVAGLAARGMQITEDATISQLTQGYGEGVCLILNELINQELMGRDFHFEGPTWAELEGDKLCERELLHDEEEVEEDLAAASKTDGGSDDESSELGPDSCVTEAWHRGREPLLEPIHTAAAVCPEAWETELERVKPHLRIVLDPSRGDGSVWRAMIKAMGGYRREIEAAKLLEVIPEGAAACCSRWRDELARIQACEERLNAAFGERAASMAGLRDETAAETERLAVLHDSITMQSQTLASLVQQVDDAKAEAGGKAEVLQDPEQLAKVRKALERLKSEKTQLDVRVKCIQRDLLNRSLRPAAPRPD
mmetsp:Transcript_108832/g.234377  ORF Transcript_108832/g.234377 Transcript_108832/m.234377 type:complete len:767 (+) Transcript_108832:194-2494(+)